MDREIYEAIAKAIRFYTVCLIIVIALYYGLFYIVPFLFEVLVMIIVWVNDLAQSGH